MEQKKIKKNKKQKINTQKLEMACGTRKAQLVLKNANLIQVFSGAIQRLDIAIADGVIVGLGSYAGETEVDLQGKFVSPGFINTHVHVESAMVTPEEYAKAELLHGVTTIITDPHEIANVAGDEGLAYIFACAAQAPLNYYVNLPSCVPATPFENAGAQLTAAGLAKWQGEEAVLGLGEMMDYVGVIAGQPEIVEKLQLFQDFIKDGHAPGLLGKGLQAYIFAGLQTDHESTTYAEAYEKLSAGMAILLREGSASKNLKDILAGMLEHKIDLSHVAFCSDDMHLKDMYQNGTILQHIKLAVALGLEPVKAIQMATLHAARIYGLWHLGAVVPGRQADLVILEDLQTFAVDSVYYRGNCVVQDGTYLLPASEPVAIPETILDSVHLPALTAKNFAVKQRQEYAVIELVPGQIITKKRLMTAAELAAGRKQGKILKIAVLERHGKTGTCGVGYLQGYGLRQGAVATTVAHDSHNLIVVGDNDADMLAAVEELSRVKGGYTLIQNQAVIGTLPLEVGGLMSLLPGQEFVAALEEMLEKAKKMGVSQKIDPFITLSFLALPVIPEIRLTDLGLFDVDAFQFIK